MLPLIITSFVPVFRIGTILPARPAQDLEELDEGDLSLLDLNLIEMKSVPALGGKDAVLREVAFSRLRLYTCLAPGYARHFSTHA